MGLFTPLAVRIGSIPWLPRYVPQIMWVDKLLQRLTRGRLSLLGLAGLPNLMLTVDRPQERHPAQTLRCCACRTARDILVAGVQLRQDKYPMWVKKIVPNPEVMARFRLSYVGDGRPPPRG